MLRLLSTGDGSSGIYSFYFVDEPVVMQPTPHLTARERPRFQQPLRTPLQRRVERFRYSVRHPFRYRRLHLQAREDRFIFVHIPKCAGTSIRQSLQGRATGHRALDGYRTMLGDELFNECFKFTFVRNPWDRLVSAFYFLKNKDLKSNQKWAKEHLSDFETFDAFVHGWVNRETIWTYSHFRPQFQFLCLEGTLPAVDFIGFYENLADDFRLIANRLGKQALLAEENKNSLRTRDYRACYNDDTRRIVAEAYAEDIELFGYSFDNSSLPNQLAARRNVA